MFTLYEEFLLLCIHEGKGTLIGSAFEKMKPGVVGAVLAELALGNKIKTANNHRLQLIDDNQTDDEILNEVLSALKESEKDRKVGYWLNTLSSKPEKLRKKITENLIQKGVVTQEDNKLLWVIPSPLNSALGASTKYWVQKRLRGIVLAQEEVQPRDLALLSLVRACNLLDLVFLRDERKLAERFVNELVVNHAMKEPAIETIQEIESVIAEILEED
jgi:Golgi phosphoprotein 3